MFFLKNIWEFQKNNFIFALAKQKEVLLKFLPP